MEWIKEGLKFLKSYTDDDQKEFEIYNSLMVLSRIRLISLATLFLSVFFACLDWNIVRSGADRIYCITLIVMHIISAFASALFLIFYNKIIGKGGKKNYRIICTVPKVYVFLYILYGAAGSINSQRYTGNIYTYIILVLIAAVAFTLKPLYMMFAFGVNHVIFLTGLNLLRGDKDILITKQSNATVLAGAALLLGVIFYRHRLMDFLFRKELKENEENFKRLFFVNPYPVFITRLKDGKVIEASKRACSLMGIKKEELDSFNSLDWYIGDNSRLALLEELKEHDSTYNRIVEYDFRGKRMWVTANYELIDYRGEKCILTGIMDITEIRKTEEELSHYASTDVLTGIMNRRMGLKKLDELMEETKEEVLEFVLCFLDINNLKYVNDTYGHGEGDRYIITLCNLIQKEIGEDDLFFRMGGDEFIIVFRNRDIPQVEEIWGRLTRKFYEVNPDKSVPCTIAASHGLFYYRSGMEMDAEQIIEYADKQMYEEKIKVKKEYAS